jgi:hypothetical protein
LEHFLRKHYHSKDQDYAPLLPEFEESDKSELVSEKRGGKRSGANQDEILSFFRNAIAKNMKLKSNIKTTRF